MMRLTLDIVAKTLFDTDVSQEAEDVTSALDVLMGKFMRQAGFAFLLLATIAQQFQVNLVPGQAIGILPSVTLRPKNGIRARVARR